MQSGAEDGAAKEGLVRTEVYSRSSAGKSLMARQAPLRCSLTATDMLQGSGEVTNLRMTQRALAGDAASGRCIMAIVNNTFSSSKVSSSGFCALIYPKPAHSRGHSADPYQYRDPRPRRF